MVVATPEIVAVDTAVANMVWEPVVEPASFVNGSVVKGKRPS